MLLLLTFQFICAAVFFCNFGSSPALRRICCKHICRCAREKRARATHGRKMTQKWVRHFGRGLRALFLKSTLVREVLVNSPEAP
uniref:Putative secreted protein n=1 Tax=Ixodes ricinus TaxID=34613 RepID=A0A6B0U9P4_IXORI